jgi:hypothetical protein
MLHRIKRDLDVLFQHVRAAQFEPRITQPKPRFNVFWVFLRRDLADFPLVKSHIALLDSAHARPNPKRTAILA